MIVRLYSTELPENYLYDCVEDPNVSLINTYGRAVECLNCGDKYSLCIQESLTTQEHDLNYCMSCGERLPSKEQLKTLEKHHSRS